MNARALWLRLRRVIGVLALVAITIETTAGAFAAAPADLILHNGKVWTVEKTQPIAQAVAVSGDKIVKVGSDKDVLALRGPQTRVIDLNGRLLLPGFNDAHTHFENAVDWYFQVRLIDVNAADTMMKRLAEVVPRVPAGIWITGGDWGDLAATSAEKAGKAASFSSFEPDLAAVDALTPNHPLLLRRYDHAYFANGKALQLARIGAKTPDPRGGKYARDAKTGALTGMMYGSAGETFEKLLPPVSHEQKLIGARGVEADLNRVGLTSIADIARVDEISQKQLFPIYTERSYSDRQIFEDLKSRGQLSVRVYAFLPLETWPELAAYKIHPGSGDAFVRYGALKAFGDSGLMFDPVKDATGLPGDWSYRFIGEDKIAAKIIEADRAGYDVGVHIIGDKAVHLLIDWYAGAAAANGAPRTPRDRRDRLIHAWYSTPEDLKRAGELHLIADVTPDHMMRGVDTFEQTLGSERAKWAFAWRTMIDDGVRVNIVSDLPGSFNKLTLAHYDPLINMYEAVARKNVGDGMRVKPGAGFHPEQALTIEEAIAAYTINPAYASHEENIKGSIAAGKLADLVVLSDDIVAGPADKLLSAKVDYTIFDGKVVYTKP
jgi:predicted amidohydrolase YtcJ